MGAQLTSIERHKGLHESAKKILSQLGLDARLLLGDGSSDISKAFGPFDKIIVTAGAPKVPMSLANQLAIGGTMVIPIGDDVSRSFNSLIQPTTVLLEFGLIGTSWSYRSNPLLSY